MQAAADTHEARVEIDVEDSSFIRTVGSMILAKFYSIKVMEMMRARS